MHSVQLSEAARVYQSQHCFCLPKIQHQGKLQHSPFESCRSINSGHIILNNKHSQLSGPIMNMPLTFHWAGVDMSSLGIILPICFGCQDLGLALVSHHKLALCFRSTCSGTTLFRKYALGKHSVRQETMKQNSQGRTTGVPFHPGTLIHHISDFTIYGAVRQLSWAMA